MDELPGLGQSRNDESIVQRDLVSEIHWDNHQPIALDNSSNREGSISFTQQDPSYLPLPRPTFFLRPLDFAVANSDLRGFPELKTAQQRQNTVSTRLSNIRVRFRFRSISVRFGRKNRAIHAGFHKANKTMTLMVLWRKYKHSVPIPKEQVKWSDHTSVVTENTYHTARSQLGMQIEKHVPGQLRIEDEYAQLLQSRRLWPVDPKEEQDWSGRGQHAKFQKNEQGLINSILEVEDNLGSTRTAVVQSVKCRRILLARKTITCGKQTMTREEAIAEVSHLTRLNHAHIVRVIGTYVKGRELSILLYPVADYNLETFLDKYRATPENSDMWWNMACSGNNFYRCLSSAVRCIHHNLTKHMDIKPQNILIRRIYEHRYSPYIADFGIARSYKTPKDIETDGRTSFTKRYAAPEVVNQGLRGLPADIFSLACVFLEMVSIYFIKNTRSAWEDGLQAIFDSNVLGDTSYQANARHLQLYLRGYLASWTNFSYSSGGLIMLIRMLDDDPRVRPTAEDLVTFFGELPCCTTGSVEFQERARDVRKDNG